MGDDYFGVGESLEEQAFGQGLVARGSQLLVRGLDLALVRQLSQEQLLRPQLSFLATSLTLDGWTSLGSKRTYSALARHLPSPIQVLTFSRWSNDQLLLRLQHTLDKAEGGSTATIDLTGLFTEFSILSLEETTLAANQPLESKRTSRKIWPETGRFGQPENQEVDQPGFYHGSGFGETDHDQQVPEEKHEDQQGLEDKKQTVAPLINLEPLQIRTFIVTVASFQMGRTTRQDRIKLFTIARR